MGMKRKFETNTENLRANGRDKIWSFNKIDTGQGGLDHTFVKTKYHCYG